MQGVVGPGYQNNRRTSRYAVRYVGDLTPALENESEAEEEGESVEEAEEEEVP